MFNYFWYILATFAKLLDDRLNVFCNFSKTFGNGWIMFGLFVYVSLCSFWKTSGRLLHLVGNCFINVCKFRITFKRLLIAWHLFEIKCGNFSTDSYKRLPVHERRIHIRGFPLMGWLGYLETNEIHILRGIDSLSFAVYIYFCNMVTTSVPLLLMQKTAVVNGFQKILHWCKNCRS